MIVLVDPGATSSNLGDRIISQAAHLHLIDELELSGVEIAWVPLHGPLSQIDRKNLREASDVLVCGTNLLSDHMRLRSPWNWSRSDIGLTAGKLTVFGAGWWQYQTGKIDWPTRRWFSDLQGSKSWALRDMYSATRLEQAGVSALHTSCPTLWGAHEQRMPGGMNRVVVTMSDYSQDQPSDQALLRLLSQFFDEIRLWPQGPGDATYFKTLGAPDSWILPPTVEDFDGNLTAPNTAYVGLRLHGGIRAVQLGVPSLILSVDNRAREISKSTGLRCPSRHSRSRINELLESTERVSLGIPTNNIAQWRSQWLAA